ncbi:MAG: hypothetical protein JW985_02580 [Alphaproteobacteria bacterium]|nr:hypothetical protein [Alphaproteobacteria bacterium]
MNVLQILYNIQNIINDDDIILSKSNFINKIYILKKLNFGLSEDYIILHDSIQGYINSLDLEYASSIEFNKKLDVGSIKKLLISFSDFISKTEISIPLDKSKTHITGGYDINNSLEYFKEQKKTQPITNDEIIKEGHNGFGLSGFELNKYVEFIKSGLKN